MSKIKNDRQEYVATTFSGLEAVLAAELEDLGAIETEIV
jgi:23S rRNA G2445 N2-methylase RlmL